MGAEAPAARAEVAGRLRNVERGDDHRRLFIRHVRDPHELARLGALVGEGFIHHHDDVALALVLVLREFRHLHAEHRQRRVRAVIHVEIEPADLRCKQVLRCRLGGAGDELLPVDDLHDAGLVRAVAEVQAITFRARGDEPVQLGRHRAGRAGLLADEAEVADEARFHWIGQIEYLRHAPRAPVAEA